MVRSRSVPVTQSELPVHDSSRPEHGRRATAATDGTARRGQHLHECIALGSELHRCLSFRVCPQPFIARGRGYVSCKGSKGCGLWTTSSRPWSAAGTLSPSAVWVTRAGRRPAGARGAAGDNGAGGPQGGHRWSTALPLANHNLADGGRAVEVRPAGTDLLDQLGDLLVDLPSLLHLAGDLVHSVDDRGVVAVAEDPADGRIAVVREVPGQVHGDLAGGDQGPGAARAADGLDGEAVAGRGGLEDHLGGDAAGFAGQDEVGEHLLGLGRGRSAPC